MTQPGVLLLDDGELHAVARVLDEMSVPYSRLVANEAAEISPPLDLLIATPGRASQVRRGSPPEAICGRPVRIIATDENSPGMRRKLKRLGFQFLVRPTAHHDVWRLLVEHATHDAKSRSSSEVSITTGRALQTATLVDVSNRGCRLRSRPEFRAGARVSFELEVTPGGAPLVLSGRVIRVAGEIDEIAGPIHTAALVFDELASVAREQLTALLNGLSHGESSHAQPGALSLPACPSADDPDFMLDDETDPLVLAGTEVRLQSQPDGAERRVHSRGAFAAPVVGSTPGRDRVLIGRDISAGGMRIASAPDLDPGDRLRIAVYGPSDMDPLSLLATVVRSDGDRGLALRFEDVSQDNARKLDKLVACLPQIESLTAHENDDRIGTVVSQILSEE